MSTLGQPAVSVIVPNYNHARYLRKRIESILAQSYQDFELILLDDSSTDDSREILRSYATTERVRFDFNVQNSGSVFRQWNKGMRLARGRYVWLAESDDFAEPAFLGRMVAILELYREVTFAFCQSWTVGENDVRFGFGDWYFSRLDTHRWRRDFVTDGHEECRRSFVVFSPVPNASAVLIRKDSYEKVGGVGDLLRLCEDYKLWVNLALQGKIAYFAEPLNSHRTHHNNMRTKAQEGALDVAEYFYVMRWAMDRVAPQGTLEGRPQLEELFKRMPAEMSAEERIHATQQTLAEIANWNLRYNQHISNEQMRAYFRDWEFALIGRSFALSPPNRWQFFLHRLYFYRRYDAGANWKQRFVNLLRVGGAPLVGYQNRHWPERAYARLIRRMSRTREEETIVGSPNGNG